MRTTKRACVLGVLVTACLVAWASGAHAQAYPPPYYPAQQAPVAYAPTWQPAPEPPERRPVHKGFFLRLGMGLGMFDDSAEVETFVRTYGVSSAGTSIGFDLSVGGSIEPGLVLAGTLLLDLVPSPRVRERGETVADTHSIRTDLFGPTIEFYPDPEEGFFTGVTVGYATMSIDDPSREVTDASSEGIGLAPHVGYGWWGNGKWSFGMLGRFRYAHMSADANDGLPTGIQRDDVVIGTLEVTATLY